MPPPNQVEIPQRFRQDGQDMKPSCQITCTNYQRNISFSMGVVVGGLAGEPTGGSRFWVSGETVGASMVGGLAHRIGLD